MNAREVLSEAYRNVVSGTARALPLAILLAAIAAGLAIVDARSIIGIERKAADFVSSGSSVRVMVARGTTDAAACERLDTVDGVRSAGALREADAVVLRAMIANPIPAYAVTPGLVEILGGTAAGPSGAWLPTGLAKTLGVKPGQELATTAGTLTVAGTYDYPDDGRDNRLTYAALLPQPATGRFDECWADVWPLSEERNNLLYSGLAVDTTTTDPVTIGQLNTSRGTRFDGVGEFAGRTTRWALPGCVLAGLLLGFVAIRIRRLEMASALHMGESRRAILATVLIETAAWALGALVLAAAALAVGVTARNSADPVAVYLVDIRGPAAAASATLIGAVSALFTVHERHLFAYFKNR